MKPALFDYHRPQTVEAALELLSRYGEAAKPIAGGQSLGPMLNMRLARPGHLVDLNDLVELDYVRETDEHLEIGALTRHHRVANAPEIRRSHPLLAAAAATIGHYAIRQRGTLGGSLVHADPAAQMPLIAALSHANVVLRGQTGTREVGVADFFRSVMTVDLRHGEMVTAIRFPKMPAGAGWGFDLFSRRRGDFAIVAVATTLSLNSNGGLSSFDLALGGVGAVPCRIDLPDVLAPGNTAAPGWIGDVAAYVAASIEPEDDKLVSAEFRREIANALTQKVLTSAVARAQEEPQ